jgi:hypothetical protein
VKRVWAAEPGPGSPSMRIRKYRFVGRIATSDDVTAERRLTTRDVYLWFWDQPRKWFQITIPSLLR